MIKKILITVVLTIWGCYALAGSSTLAERRAMSAPHSKTQNINVLTHFLTQGFNTKEDQASAIAVWIAAHIKYDNYSFAAGVKNSGFKVRTGLQANGQTAKDVFESGIGTCAGYADLYEKMLTLAHIKSEKVYGYVLSNVPSLIEAKRQIKKESIGHVWNKVYVDKNKPILVDITFMASGRAGDIRKTLSESMKRKEIRQAKKFKSTYPYDMKYFNFEYNKLQSSGEYRFSLNKQLY